MYCGFEFYESHSIFTHMAQVLFKKADQIIYRFKCQYRASFLHNQAKIDHIHINSRGFLWQKYKVKQDYDYGFLLCEVLLRGQRVYARKHLR